MRELLFASGRAESGSGGPGAQLRSASVAQRRAPNRCHRHDAGVGSSRGCLGRARSVALGSYRRRRPAP